MTVDFGNWKKFFCKEETSEIKNETVYRKNGNLIEKIISRNSNTNEILKITYFDYFNDKKIKSVEEFKNNKKIREINFSLFKSVTDYDLKTGKKLKTTNYNPNNSNKKVSTYDYDLQTGKIIKMSVFKTDGKNPAFVKELSSDTGLITRCINYKTNSSAIASVAKYDFLDNTTIKTTYYYNSPIKINTPEEADKKIIADNINRKILSTSSNNKIASLIDTLYTNKMNFSMINNS